MHQQHGTHMLARACAVLCGQCILALDQQSFEAVCLITTQLLFLFLLQVLDILPSLP